jgi:predicted acetyltransferase
MTRITRTIADDEIDQFLRINRESFSFRPTPNGVSGVGGDEDRRYGVFDDGELVGIGRNYTMELTMPGGAFVPVGGVSWIGVHPMHRRRGVMAALITALVADSTARGEAASILTASEGSIYWGQGYGPATWGVAGEVNLSRRPTLFGGAAGEGNLRMLDVGTSGGFDVGISGGFDVGIDGGFDGGFDGGLVGGLVDALAAVLKPMYEMTRSRAGHVSRPDYWWRTHLHELITGADYVACVVHQNVAGVDDGYVIYKVTGTWGADGSPDKVLDVVELITAEGSSVSYRALWQHLIERDLVRTVRTNRLPIDDSIRLLFTDVRAFATRSTVDRLWIRPIDTYTLLSSRTFAPGDPVVISVDGVGYRLAEGGVELSGANPDLVMSGAALGAALLGGTEVSALVMSGRAVSCGTDAAHDADILLRCTPKPTMLTGF